MLEQIHIQNIGLVENLTIDFHQSITMFTGETGAGKSMLLSSLLLLSGEKMDESTIRRGAESASITSLWTIAHNTELRDWLDDRSIILEQDELLVKRTFKKNGRGQNFIQGNAVTLKELSECMEYLCEIHTQYEHQALFKPIAQLTIIDKFSGLQERVENYKKSFARYTQRRTMFTQSVENEKNRHREIDYLKYAIREIDQAHIDVNEDERITEELKKAVNMEKIMSLWNDIDTSLHGSESYVHEDSSSALSSAGALELLRRTVTHLTDLVGLYTINSAHLEGLQSIVLDLEDLSQELQTERGHIQHIDPHHILALETRLALLEGLKKKYGSTLQDVRDFFQDAKNKLDTLENFESNKEKLEKEFQELHQHLESEASHISTIRKQSAHIFSSEVNKVLHKLAMGQANFTVEFTEHPINSNGIDAISFYISSNKNEKAFPLIKIASGGELSRVMLAIKVISTMNDTLHTLILDEIDAGIGGNTARELTSYLQSIGKNTQVICVTHLPIVVASANYHYYVYKLEGQERTKVEIKLLDDITRVEEMARMLVGTPHDVLAQDQARNLLQHFDTIES